MAPKMSADSEPCVPSSATSSQEDAEPWQQSSSDLRLGLEVTEVPPNETRAEGSATDSGGATASEIRQDAGNLEAVYVDWLERLNGRLPEREPHHLRNGDAPWVRHFDGLPPEEAAQLAATWWDQRRTLP
jgi:hypothetical protein